MVVVAQSVRALDCGSKGRGFESHLPPANKKDLQNDLQVFFVGILKEGDVARHVSTRVL